MIVAVARPDLRSTSSLPPRLQSVQESVQEPELPPPSSACQDSREYWRELAAQGIIHPFLSEKLRTLEGDHPATIRLNELLLPLVKRLYPERDFTADPIQFLWTDGDGMSYLTGSTPTTILIGKNFLSDGSSRGLCNLSGLAGGLCHELYHETLARKFGPEHRNSPLEESLSDLSGFQRIYDAGLRPDQLAEYFRGQVGTRTFGYMNALVNIFDVHPVDSLRVRTAEMALYDFRRTHKDFDLLQESSEDKALFAEILSVGQGVIYVSPLEKRLLQGGYDQLSLEEKMAILAKEIGTAPHFSERTSALHQKISALKFPPLSESNAPEFSTRLNELYESIFIYLVQPISLMNAEVSRISSDRSDDACCLLESLHERLFDDASYPVTSIHRLKRMQTTVESLFTAATPEEAVRHAEALIEIDFTFMKETGLCLSRNPNGPRHIRNTLDRAPWGFRKELKIGEVVPWQSAFEIACRNTEYRETIVRGLLFAGVYDHRLGALITRATRLEFADESLPFSSSSPLFGFNDYAVRRLEIDPSGRIIAEHSHDALAQWEESLRGNPELRRLDSRFLNIARPYQRSRIQSLAFDIDPQSYHALFSVSLQNSHRYQQELVDHISSLFQDPAQDHDHLRTCVKSLYQRYLSYKSHDVLFFIKNGARAATESPLYRFMMEDPHGCFDAQWRISILAMNSCVGRAALYTQIRMKGKKNLLARQREGEVFHEPLREELHKLMPEISPQGARSWQELIMQLELFNERFSLQPPDFYAGFPKAAARFFVGLTECIRLGKEGITPTPAELGSIIALAKKEYGLFSHYSGADDTLYALFRPTLGYPVNWSQDNLEALRAWKKLDEVRFWRGNESFHEIARILDRIEKNPDAEKRFEELSFLFQECFPPETEFQQRAIEICADTARVLLEGRDDGTDRYRLAFEKLCGPLFSNAPKGIQRALVEKVLTTIRSQTRVTEFARNIVREVDDKAFQDSNLWGRLLNTSEGISRLSMEERQELLDFLTGSGSVEAIDSFIDKESFGGILYRIRRAFFHDVDFDQAVAPTEGLLPSSMSLPDAITLDTKRVFYRDFLSRLHRNFWMAPLEEKLLIAMQPLFPLNATSDQQDASFDYVVEKRLAASTDHHVIDKIKLGLGCYLSTQTEGDRALLLTATLVSSNPYDEESCSRIGQVGARVLPAMGPLEAKIAQAVQGHPDTKPQVAKDMATTKYLADPPNRIELFETRDLHTPKPVLAQIQHTGDLRGSGSFYLALDVSLRDGREGVLRILRKNAKERAAFGGMQLRKALVDPRLASAFSEEDIATARDVLAQGEAMWSEEIDPRLIVPSQSAMEKFCDGAKVIIWGREIRFIPRRILSIEGYGPVSSAECSLSTRIEGPHYIELEKSTHKTDVAIAVCTRVLHAILNGESFPTDLMGGNAKVHGNEVGMFDPGGMFLHSDDASDMPVKRDILQLLISGGEGFSGIMSRELREKYGSIHTPEGRFLSAVQKATLALYDFIEEVPKDVVSDIGRAALKKLSPERLRELNAPFLLKASLWLPNQIKIVT